MGGPVPTSAGDRLRAAMEKDGIVPMIGIYDTFSATLAARYFSGLFVSGFSFAASFYGLPDIGYIAWSDMVAFVQRLRNVLPEHHLLVDIDDGYGDPEVACHVVRQLDRIGASAVVLEDQQRPRRCGHLEGKQIMTQEAYLDKLRQVLAARGKMLVIARTDAVDAGEAERRALAYAAAGADAVLVEAVRELPMLAKLKSKISVPIVFNQIAGGKSPMASLGQLRELGVSLVNYSTPCLFSAQAAIVETMARLTQTDGLLSARDGADLGACNRLLHENAAQIRLPE